MSLLIGVAITYILNNLLLYSMYRQYMYSLTKINWAKNQHSFSSCRGQTYSFTIVHCIGPGKMSKEQRVVREG